LDDPLLSSLARSVASFQKSTSSIRILGPLLKRFRNALNWMIREVTELDTLILSIARLPKSMPDFVSSICETTPSILGVARCKIVSEMLYLSSSQFVVDL
jgi:hypothetical protein